MRTRARSCVDCRRRGPYACATCAEQRRRLDALHDFARRHQCPADAIGRARRVALYAAIVAAGGRLFESRPTDARSA